MTALRTEMENATFSCVNGSSIIDLAIVTTKLIPFLIDKTVEPTVDSPQEPQGGGITQSSENGRYINEFNVNLNGTCQIKIG